MAEEVLGLLLLMVNTMAAYKFTLCYVTSCLFTLRYVTLR